MSLVAFAIRIAAERAVWSGFTVVESPQNPIATIEKTGKPLIALFTGHDTDKIEGRDLLGGSTMQSFRSIRRPRG